MLSFNCLEVNHVHNFNKTSSKEWELEISGASFHRLPKWEIKGWLQCSLRTLFGDEVLNIDRSCSSSLRSEGQQWDVQALKEVNQNFHLFCSCFSVYLNLFYLQITNYFHFTLYYIELHKLGLQTSAEVLNHPWLSMSQTFLYSFNGVLLLETL